MSYKDLKALGFVEVLFALVVVCIASAVFLTVAGKAMKSLVQTERIEYMARIATDGANIAQEIGNQEKASLVSGEKHFPTESNDIGDCFVPLREGEGSEVTYSFLKDESGQFKNFSNDDRASYILNGSDMYEEYFLVMCIEDIDDEGTGWASVYFIVGDINVAGQATTDSDFRDFTYYAIIDL